jgi:hypothetical protein
MPTPSHARTLAVRGALLQITDHLHDAALKLAWIQPAAADHLAEPDRAVLASAMVTTEELHREIEAMALAEEVTAA